MNSGFDLKSNFVLDGNNKIIKGQISKKKVNFVSFPVIKIINKKNVVVKNLIIDGDFSSQTFSKLSNLEDLNNLVQILSSENITFENCIFRNHTSNWDDKKEVYFGAVGIRNSSFITFKNCRLENFQTEGIVFYESSNIVIQNLQVESKIGWTPLHFWYCNKIKCEDVKMNLGKDGGSSITGAYKDAVFKNINIKGGMGIQFSNEMNAKKFTSEKIIFDTCVLETNTFGIARWNYDDSIANNITIRNCNFKIDYEKPNQHYWGVRIDYANRVKIENNIFELNHPNSSVFCLLNLKNTIVDSNFGNANNVFFLYFVNNCIDNLQILKNSFNYNFIKSNQDYDRSFIYYNVLEQNNCLNNLKIQQNKLHNFKPINNSFTYFNLKVSNFILSDNYQK